MANKTELAEIRRIAKDHVELWEQNFRRKYCNADKKTLLAYLRRCAKLLDGTLDINDVVGVEFIKQRLGSSWDKLLQAEVFPKYLSRNV